MTRALNFKRYEKGSMIGFLDIGYGGLVVKGCRLMESGNGFWIAMPSRPIEKDGQTTYQDIVELTKSEAEHIRRMVLADLEQQGHLSRPAGKPKLAPQNNRPANRDDMGNYYSQPGDDDVPY